MFSIASQVARRTVGSAARHQLTLRAGFAQTVKEGLTATDAWSKSCYSDMDYTINENLSVYEAVQKFAAYNVGCLVTTNDEGENHLWIFIVCVLSKTLPHDILRK